MHRNRLLPALCVAGLLAGMSLVGTTLGHFPTAFSLTSHPAAAEDSTVSQPTKINTLQQQNDAIGAESAAGESNKIADEVLFDMFLIKVVSLQNAARKSKERGESERLWGEYLKRNGFSDQEAYIIRQIANEHAASIKPIHAKALQVIRAARKSLKDGKEMPPPPPELQAFQEKRNAVVKLSRAKLANRLGNETVEKVRLLMKASSRQLPIDRTTLGG